MTLLATTRQNIAKLLDELELSPNTSFEHDVVYDPESVSVTADSMRTVKRYNDEVFQFLDLSCTTIACSVVCSLLMHVINSNYTVVLLSVL